MSETVLLQRAQALQAELQRAKQNLLSISEQHDQAKAHLSMVSGHLNEVAYLLGEEKKAKENVQNSVPENLNEMKPENDKIIQSDEC